MDSCCFCELCMKSPLLVAPKTDKDALHLLASEQYIWMCEDYRELNKLIVDEYDNALPRIWEILNSLGPFEWVTMIDLEDSYNQMQIVVNDHIKPLLFLWESNECSLWF